MTNWIKRLVTFFGGEPSPGPVDVTDGGAFFEEENEDGAGEEQGAESATATEAQAEETAAEEPVDANTDTPEGDTSDEGTPEDNGESTESPDSEGDGADEGGASAAAAALREAVRARLIATKAATPEGERKVNIKVPTLADLKKIDKFKDLEDDDLARVLDVVDTALRSALEGYHADEVKPISSAAAAQVRKNRIVSNWQDFVEKHPDVPKDRKRMDAMSAQYDALAGELGRDLADTVTFNELYLMSGGRGKKVAATTQQGVATRLAKEQKNAAMKADTQTERVGKVRAGGTRQPSKDAEMRRKTVEHIQRTVVNPFTIG
jgi:hypothetical protein